MRILFIFTIFSSILSGRV